MGEVMTIGEVAKRSGVATSALRYYEEQGLIHAERNDSGHRRYARAVLRRVAFVVFAQKIGLSLEEIRAELGKLPSNRVPERSDWARLSTGWTRRIRERIARLVLRSASAVGASRSTGAGLPTPAIVLRVPVTVQGIGWVGDSFELTAFLSTVRSFDIPLQASS